MYMRIKLVELGIEIRTDNTTKCIARGKPLCQSSRGLALTLDVLELPHFVSLIKPRNSQVQMVAEEQSSPELPDAQARIPTTLGREMQTSMSIFTRGIASLARRE